MRPCARKENKTEILLDVLCRLKNTMWREKNSNIEEMTEGYTQFNEQEIIVMAVAAIFVHNNKNQKNKEKKFEMNNTQTDDRSKKKKKPMKITTMTMMTT